MQNGIQQNRKTLANTRASEMQGRYIGKTANNLAAWAVFKNEPLISREQG